MRGLRTLSRGLRRDRRAVAATRRTHDREILAAAPLVVRSDLAGGGTARIVKQLYDAWLGAYWAVASMFLK